MRLQKYIRDQMSEEEREQYIQDLLDVVFHLDETNIPWVAVPAYLKLQNFETIIRKRHEHSR